MLTQKIGCTRLHYFRQSWWIYEATNARKHFVLSPNLKFAKIFQRAETINAHSVYIPVVCIPHSGPRIYHGVGILFLQSSFWKGVWRCLRFMDVRRQVSCLSCFLYLIITNCRSLGACVAQKKNTMRKILLFFCLLFSFCTMAQNVHNGHEYVDLGLPSGIKWATCNVGATAPERSGGYYAWGETEEKADYSWATYKWCNGVNNTMTKYCTDSIFGTVDNNTVLDPEDDVAAVKWGGNWRMPTTEELYELITECTLTWTTLNRVYGYRMTGPNGNSIFLPAAGGRNDAKLINYGDFGYYWSASLNSDRSYKAYFLRFRAIEYDLSTSRCSGRTVRPVYDDSATDIKDIIFSDTDATAVYYDLQGRRVEQPVSGIYIVNGKKVLIK